LLGARASTVRARVPASSANLGAGFDVLSIALESPRIEIELRVATPGRRAIEVDGAYADEVSTDPSLNAAGKALSAVSERFVRPDGYLLRISANIPPKKGLGLSGAEAVGAILCADRIFKLGLKGRSLIEMAGEAEPSHHLDNVSASAFGGFNIVTRSPIGAPPEITTILPPNDLGIALLVPNIEKTSTEDTRQLLPLTVPTTAHIQSMGYVARISAAFAMGDVKGILETLPWDEIVEPTRADSGVYGKGIDSRFLQDEKKLLLERFHVAETISGAGPSRALWYSISEDLKRQKKNKTGLIQPAITLVSDNLKSLGHEVREVFLTRPSAKGATII
jgi:homoserine kinase